MFSWSSLLLWYRNLRFEFLFMIRVARGGILAAKNDTISLVSDLFSPIDLFHLFLTEVSLTCAAKRKSICHCWIRKAHISWFLIIVAEFYCLYSLQIHYDHQVLLDYLISKDTGDKCAEYLLRYVFFLLLFGNVFNLCCRIPWLGIFDTWWYDWLGRNRTSMDFFKFFLHVLLSYHASLISDFSGACVWCVIHGPCLWNFLLVRSHQLHYLPKEGEFQ